MEDDDDLPTYPARCLCESKEAIRVIFTDDYPSKRAEWVPKSQIHDNSEVYERGHVGNLVVTRWFAKQRGWIDG